MKLFYLDVWNDCHRRNCVARFNCRCGNSIFTTDRECIDLSWLCDGIPDCSGGEDEMNCVCSDDEFQCNYCGRGDECDDGIPLYQCIDESRVDDGSKDCGNGNDELERDQFNRLVCKQSSKQLKFLQQQNFQ